MIQRVKYIGGRMIEDIRGELALMPWKDYAALKREANERDHLRAVNAEMLEALEDIMSMIDDGNALDETWDLEFARAAIARARG